MKRGLLRILAVLMLAALVFTGITAAADDETLIVRPSKHNIEIMGKKADLEAYNINGYNYFKLRDVVEALGFYVAWDDALQKITVSDRPVSSGSVFIMIDAGHGGTDAGALSKSTQLYEKDINLSVAEKLSEMLRAEGYIVGMTRTEDETLAVTERMDMILMRRPDLIISVHHNASDDASRSGAYVLCQVDDREGGRTTRLAGFLQEEFENIGQTYLGNVYRRGSRGDYYGLLRAAASVGIPAVITEFAFIDNPTDLKLIDTEEKQEAEARAIYTAVIRFLQSPESEYGASDDAAEGGESGETDEASPDEGSASDDAGTDGEEEMDDASDEDDGYDNGYPTWLRP